MSTSQTENPTGALRGYLKTPEKYKHLQQKSEQLQLPLQTESETPTQLDQLSNEEKIKHMKALQETILKPYLKKDA